MGIARHPRPQELEGVSLEEIMQKYVARFEDRVPDWNAFADANIDGYRRAQHRFIGAGASGKHDDQSVIPAGSFTLSIMLVPPGQGNASHTHEVEELFFVLDGEVTVFIEDETERRVSAILKKWDCISCPAGVIHGYHNHTDKPMHLIVSLGKGRPEVAGFAKQTLYDKRESHLDEAR